MKKINVFDTDAEEIEKICEEYEIPTASLIEALMSAVSNGDVDLDDYI